MKNQKQLIKECYLNKRQISRLLGTTPATARRIFAEAEKIDNELEFRIETKKVRTSSALKVYGIKMDELIKKMEA